MKRHDQKAAPQIHVSDKNPVASVVSGQPEYDLLHGWGLYKTMLRSYNIELAAAAEEVTEYKPAPVDLKQSH